MNMARKSVQTAISMLRQNGAVAQAASEISAILVACVTQRWLYCLKDLSNDRLDGALLATQIRLDRCATSHNRRFQTLYSLGCIFTLRIQLQLRHQHPRTHR